MGLFGKKKNDEPKPEERLEENMRDDISKAYDELTSETAPKEEASSAPEQETKQPSAKGSFEAELLKAKIRTFKEKKTNESLVDVFNSIGSRKFFIPSVSNMKDPFEKNGSEVKIKPGATLTPALLTTKDKKFYLPIFTDEQSMTQKSPSGVTLQMSFDQCIGIVYNKKNPVSAVVINPFTENFVIGEDLLKAVFKKLEDENTSK